MPLFRYSSQIWQEKSDFSIWNITKGDGKILDRVICTDPGMLALICEISVIRVNPWFWFGA